MHSSTLSVILIIFAICVFTPCESFGVGEYAPMVPTEKEIEMCINAAESNEVGYKKAEKELHKTCFIKCIFDDGGTKVLESPKGIPCCDIGGVAPTGTCDGKGKCDVMKMN